MLSVKGPPNLEKLSRHKPPKHLQGYWANLYIVASIFAPNYGTRLETVQDAANRNCRSQQPSKDHLESWLRRRCFGIDLAADVGVQDRVRGYLRTSLSIETMRGT